MSDSTSSVAWWNVDFKRAQTPLCKLAADNHWEASHTPLVHALLRHARETPLRIGCMGAYTPNLLYTLRAYLAAAAAHVFCLEHDSFDMTHEQITRRRTQPPLDVFFVNDASARLCARVSHACSMLVPGGMLLIEHVYDEDVSAYMTALTSLLAARTIQDAYFVSIAPRQQWPAHNLVLVVVNSGAAPLFTNRMKLTLVTPCCRPANLVAVAATIPWDIVHKWYIVYDGARVQVNPHQFAHMSTTVVETMFADSRSIAGHAQRNHALDCMSAVTDGNDSFLYFLDDDNAFHPALTRLLRSFACDDMLYSFNQGPRLRGHMLQTFHIDTAMVLLNTRKIGHVRWQTIPYYSDGLYIEACAAVYGNQWTFIDNDCCFYNALVK